ncbi:nuclear transport factor 2 family protein [Embleya sp. NPDC005971]|uniref:nuclear transport factor 2 family protein n=1 Tax=Embleya sp. NPDC005971 TaxID=3156724 RepID=UPI0033ECB233
MPLTVEDKLAIQELAARQFKYLDAHDVDAWAQCWIPDGTFVANYGTFQGHTSIMEFLRGHIAAGKEDGARHLGVNHVIEGDAERAEMYSVVVKLQVVQSPFIIATGIYRDTLVRTPDGWRFESRRLDIDPGVFAAGPRA